MFNYAKSLLLMCITQGKCLAVVMLIEYEKIPKRVVVGGVGISVWETRIKAGEEGWNIEELRWNIW